MDKKKHFFFAKVLFLGNAVLKTALAAALQINYFENFDIKNMIKLCPTTSNASISFRSSFSER